MTYAIIKDDSILCLTDKIPAKKYMEFDKAIELDEPYDQNYDYSFVNGVIVKEERKLKEAKKRQEEITQEIGALKVKMSGMQELGEDTTEIEAQISSLKAEYESLK